MTTSTKVPGGHGGARAHPSAGAAAPHPSPIPPGPLPPDPLPPEPIPEPGQPFPPSPPGPFPGPLPPGPAGPDPVARGESASYDPVRQAGEESFPASDPPSYSPTTARPPRRGSW